jgi:hypothetical protein
VRPLLLALPLLALACNDTRLSERGPVIDDPAESDDTDVEPVGELPIPTALAPLYANTTGDLFEVDPANGDVVHLGAFKDGDQPIDGMVDIAIDLEGRLYGGTYDALWRIDPETAAVAKVCDIDVAMYALAFTSAGDLVAGAGSDIQIIDVETCRDRVLVSDSRYETSGDLVGLPDGYLYWSVRGGRDEPDELVRIDPRSGRQDWVGVIGFGKLYGMAYYDGALYGFSSEGNTVRIRPESGRSNLLGFDGAKSWWGATTNPVVWTD